MRNKNLLFPSVAVCLFLMGCGGKEAQFVGSWTGTDISVGGNIPPVVAQMLKQRASQFTLDVKQDRHFAMTAETGTWSVRDDHLILKIATIGGKTPDELKKDVESRLSGASAEMKAQAEKEFESEQTGTLGKDGKSLSVVIGKITVIFKKKAA